MDADLLARAGGSIIEQQARIERWATYELARILADRQSAPPPQYVTLDQMAACVSRSKRTLEGWVKKAIIPDPDVEGGGGKPHLWKWENVRKILEDESGIPQPAQFFGH